MFIEAEWMVHFNSIKVAKNYPRKSNLLESLNVVYVNMTTEVNIFYFVVDNTVVSVKKHS